MLTFNLMPQPLFPEGAQSRLESEENTNGLLLAVACGECWAFAVRLFRKSRWPPPTKAEIDGPRAGVPTKTVNFGSVEL